MEHAFRDARAKLADLVAAAERGERVIITKHGRPVVEIIPVRPAAGIDFDHLQRVRARLGLGASRVEIAADFDDPSVSRAVLGLSAADESAA
jgi:prevent-host-death family protein